MACMSLSSNKGARQRSSQLRGTTGHRACESPSEPAGNRAVALQHAWAEPAKSDIFMREGAELLRSRLRHRDGRARRTELNIALICVRKTSTNAQDGVVWAMWAHPPTREGQWEVPVGYRLGRGSKVGSIGAPRSRSMSKPSWRRPTKATSRRYSAALAGESPVAQSFSWARSSSGGRPRRRTTTSSASCHRGGCIAGRVSQAPGPRWSRAPPPGAGGIPRRRRTTSRMAALPNDGA